MVDYLNAANYFGIDLSADLIEVGYSKELTGLGLQHKLPKSNLHCDDSFDATSFGVIFYVVFAHSLFTHLQLNHLKLALKKLADVVKEGGVFFVTVFLVPDGNCWSEPLFHSSLGRYTYPEREPFHHSASDIDYCTTGLPWTCDVIGDWAHARGQSMVRFTKTDS